MKKASRAAIIGTCMVVPGGIIGLALLAYFDPEIRNKLIEIKDTVVDKIKELGEDDEEDE